MKKIVAIYALAMAGLLLVCFAMSSAFADNATPTPPAAPAKCIPVDQLIQIHKQKWNESPVDGGVTKTGGLIVFSSPKGETWTVVAINEATGIACMISEGTGYHLKQLGQEI